YAADDRELVAERLRCRLLLRTLNEGDPADYAARANVLGRLLHRVGARSWIEPPFHCDYGYNIAVGARFYANFGCVFLDCARIDIDDAVLLGPAEQLYTATHPLDAEERVRGLERARPIRVGARVWIGGSAIVLPGVSIGEGTTIAAGSVVTRDVPARVLAAGNPCRVVRSLARAG